MYITIFFVIIMSITYIPYSSKNDESEKQLYYKWLFFTLYFYKFTHLLGLYF